MRTKATPELRAPIRVGRAVAIDETVALDATAAAQLAFREVNPKEAFTLVDATGAFFRASLKGLGASGGEALVYEAMRGSPESPASITLVCAVLARQRMITVVQKAAELGCARIAPVLSDHAVKKVDLDKEKPWAWPGQAIKGARQCRRATVPEVLDPAPLAAALGAPWWRAARARFTLDDRAPEGVDPFAGPRGGELVLAIGPEGGWSDAERGRLAEAGAIPVALGARVLRAETAVFAGLAVLQHRLGDLAGGYPS